MNFRQHPGLLLGGSLAVIAFGLMVQNGLRVQQNGGHVQSVGFGSNDASVEVLRSRELRFLPLVDGREAVLDAASGGLVYTLPADKNKDSFLRVTIRILKRNRSLRNANPEAPFRLELNREEGLTLVDALSDSRLPIRAFGVAAVASLSPLLTAPAVPVGALPPTCPRPEC